MASPVDKGLISPTILLLQSEPPSPLALPLPHHRLHLYPVDPPNGCDVENPLLEFPLSTFPPPVHSFQASLLPLPLPHTIPPSWWSFEWLV